MTDLNTALSKADPAAAAALFETEGCWRDLASLTWNIKTMEGPDEIAAMLAAQMANMSIQLQATPSRTVAGPAQSTSARGAVAMATRQATPFRLALSPLGALALRVPCVSNPFI